MIDVRREGSNVGSVSHLSSVVAIVISLVCIEGTAHADPAAAEGMFRQGRVLLADGQLDAACDLFEASNQLEPSAGTLLNLGECRVRQGRSATAWAHFLAAARLAEQQGRPRHANEARRRAVELEPNLAYLTIALSEVVPGMDIRRNGLSLGTGAIGATLACDPGAVVVEVLAPGYAPLRAEAMARPGQREVVSMPRLIPVELPQPQPGGTFGSPLAAAEPAPHWPWVVGGAGVAALGVGAALGVNALSSNAAALRLCANRTRSCPTEAVREADKRDRLAIASTIGVGVGLSALVVAGWQLLNGQRQPVRDDTAWRATWTLSGRAAVLEGELRF